MIKIQIFLRILFYISHLTIIFFVDSRKVFNFANADRLSEAPVRG